MASIFISHSSIDKPFAHRLIESLEREGHTCWIDEKQIKVGERIIGKIQEGLKDSDYIALLLSSNSVKSKWVEEEWAVQYWEQVNSGKIILLPVLIEQCEIPKLLTGIKYADFTKGYDIGLAGLLLAVGTATVEEIISSPQKDIQKKQHLSSFLTKVAGNTNKLSTCLAEGIVAGLNAESSVIEEFCKNELVGWGKSRKLESNEKQPDYRKITVLLSPYKITGTYGLNSVEEAFSHAVSEGQGVETSMLLAESVSQLESQADVYPVGGGFYTTSHEMQEFNPEAPADMVVYVYINPKSYGRVLSRIRQHLIDLVISEMN